jgi:hypothetical protein
MKDPEIFNPALTPSLKVECDLVEVGVHPIKRISSRRM